MLDDNNLAVLAAAEIVCVFASDNTQQNDCNVGNFGIVCCSRSNALGLADGCCCSDHILCTFVSAGGGP